MSHTRSGYAINILSVTPDGLYKDFAQLEDILNERIYRDKPLYIVSVGGTYRTGKSFLLNYFMRYLLHHNEYEAFGAVNIPLDGFTWRTGVHATTCGIDVWSDPFMLKLPTGEDVVILLMDTEGTQDVKGNMERDIRIFALSLILSDFQILSLQSQFTANDIDCIRMFTDFAKVYLQLLGEESKLQHLLFLVRDWLKVDSYELGFDGGQQMFEDVLQTEEDSHLTDIRKHLEETFVNVETFLLPHPGLIVQSNKFRGSVNELNEDFVEQLKLLCAAVFDPELLAVKTIQNTPVTCAQFLIWLKQYAKIFESTKPPTLGTVTEALGRASYIIGLEKCYHLYEEQMQQEYFDNEDFTDLHKLDEIHEIVANQVMEMFESIQAFGRDQLYEEMQRNLLNYLDDAYRRQREFCHKFLQQNQMAHDKLQLQTMITRFESEARDKIMTRLSTSNNAFGRLISDLITSYVATLESQLTSSDDAFRQQILQTLREALAGIRVNIMDTFATMKTADKNQKCAFECVSKYDNKMFECFHQLKHSTDVADLLTAHNNTVRMVMEYFASKIPVGCADHERLKTTVLNAIAEKYHVYEFMFKERASTSVTNLNESFVDRAIDQHKRHLQDDNIQQEGRFDDRHRVHSKTVDGNFRDQLIGERDRMELIRKLHRGLLRNYYNLGSNISYLVPFANKESHWNSKLIKMEKWHVRMFLDGKPLKMVESAGDKSWRTTEVVNDTVTYVVKPACAIWGWFKRL